MVEVTKMRTETGSRTRTIGEIRGETIYLRMGYYLGTVAGAQPGQPFLQLVVPVRGRHGRTDGFAPYGAYSHAGYAVDVHDNWWFIRWQDRSREVRCQRCKRPNHGRLPPGPKSKGMLRAQWGHLGYLKEQAVRRLDAALSAWQLEQLRARCDLI